MNPHSGRVSYAQITPQEIEQKLHSRFAKEGFLTLSDLPDPSMFKNMERATQRIVNAIKEGEKIVLIGDYDVDGVVSTTVMKLFFDAIGVPLKWIIPNRFRDGYGLSSKLIPQIAGYDLAITVDNGIAAVEAAQRCKEEGIELIITDHHLLPQVLPQAYAIIDQKQPSCPFPYEEVCGAQIAWYLIASLNRALGTKVNTKSFIALVAIAIIADMMPLQHINRAMVISGLALLPRVDFPAIKAFLEYLDKVQIEAEDIAFWMAPILNSAGRLEDAKWAVEFLLSDNLHDARTRLNHLIALNEKRKEIEQEITQEASSKVDSNDAVIVVAGEGWHEGVIGIVAARIGRRYEKPTILLTDAQNGELKGSGRSFNACNLFEITQASRSLLSKFGGHHAAIGLSLPRENFEPFKAQIQANFHTKKYPIEQIDPDILGRLSFVDISLNLTAMMQRYEPFGQGNPRPKFLTQGVEIVELNRMGKNREHHRFLLFHEGKELQAVLFKSEEEFDLGERVDIVYTINENHFNNRITLQLMIEKIIRIPRD